MQQRVQSPQHDVKLCLNSPTLGCIVTLLYKRIIINNSNKKQKLYLF
jgi:hypothetical protein